ncbi:MAG TPA: BatD family protein, partial [Longimicrobiales bacterium]
LTLTTVAPGHYVIPPLAIRVDGSTYRTRPLRLDVAAAYAGPAGSVGETASGPDDEVLLQSWATPDTVWVGQQVTVRADALFATDLRSRLAGAPQYEGAGGPGFWVYDLGSSTEPQLRPVRGRMYEVQTFRRAYFPLSPGRFLLPGARLAYAVRRGFLSGPETYDLHSDSMPVVVRPLPAVGRPDGFAGAVGQYSAAARLDPTSVSAGEATTLTLEVRGDGNIKALPPPRLPALAGVQVFTPAEDAELRPDDEQVGGVKRFTWVLVPSAAGKVVIPPLELDYFNPANGHYEIAQTEALGLEVGAAVAGRGGSSRPAALGAALRPLRARDSGAGAAQWVHAPAFKALAALPVMALLALGLEGMVRRRRKARALARPHGGSAMLERLRGECADLRALAAEAPGTGLDAGFEEGLLYRIGAWLGERLGKPELAGTGSSRLDGALRDAGVRPVVAAGLAGLVGQLEVARYRPTAATAAQRVAWVDEAERLLAEVHAGASGRRRQAPAGGSASPLIMLTLAALAWGGLTGAGGAGAGGVAEPIRVRVVGAEASSAGEARFA